MQVFPVSFQRGYSHDASSSEGRIVNNTAEHFEANFRLAELVLQGASRSACQDVLDTRARRTREDRGAEVIIIGGDAQPHQKPRQLDQIPGTHQDNGRSVNTCAGMARQMNSETRMTDASR